MGYKISKPFKENGVEKVKIIATGGSRGLFLIESTSHGKRVKERIYEVINKKELYEDIKKINEGSEDAPQKIDISNKYIKGFSLRDYKEKNKINWIERVSLKNFCAEATFFDGGADFSIAKFSGGDISFMHAIFNAGNVNFQASIFESGNIFFEDTNFGDGSLSFQNTTFGDGFISFESAFFGNGDVDFNLANFGAGVISFKLAFFGNGKISFYRTVFGQGNVYFDHAIFGEGYFSFVDIKFDGGKVSFFKTNFGGKYVFFHHLKIFKDWDLRVKEAQIIDFLESTIYGYINLGFYLSKEGIEYTPKVQVLRLANSKLYGRIHVDYDAFNLGQAINRQGGSHRNRRDQFRLLKENFRSLGQYDDEDKTYVQFMKHKIRHNAGFDDFIPKTIKGLKEVIKKIYYNPFMDTTFKRKLKYFLKNFTKFKDEILGFASFPFKWLVFEKMGLYGTSPARVALSMAVVLAIFTLIYIPLTGTDATTPSPLFHSVITFLTIGYGDNYINMNSFWGQFFSGIEGFLGLFLMSYFTISFVRKVLR